MKVSLTKTKLKNELEIIKKHFEIDSEKLKKTFEDDARRLIESNVSSWVFGCNHAISIQSFLLKDKFKILQEKIENENKSIKNQFVSIQVSRLVSSGFSVLTQLPFIAQEQNKALESKLYEIGTINEINKISIKNIGLQLNQFESFKQSFTANLRESDLITETFSRNGMFCPQRLF
jgi:hypothetical protein